MNQIGENGKTPRFGPEFGPFGPNSDCQFFFSPQKIWLYQLLDVMVSFHQAQHQKKLITQS